MEARENKSVGAFMRPVVVSALLFMVVCGLVYPLLTTGVAQVVFPSQADGSLIEADGEVVGSALLGQQFTEPEYFHPRPSVTVATDGSGDSVPYNAAPYNAAQSAGSNYGPTNEELIAEVRQRAEDYREENNLSNDALVPVDAVTSSGSGLDPHITPANAGLQAERIAEARGIPEDEVRTLIVENTDGRFLGFIGEPGVNVLELNLALDETES